MFHWLKVHQVSTAVVTLGVCFLIGDLLLLLLLLLLSDSYRHHQLHYLYCHNIMWRCQEWWKWYVRPLVATVSYRQRGRRRRMIAASMTITTKQLLWLFRKASCHMQQYLHLLSTHIVDIIVVVIIMVTIIRNTGSNNHYYIDARYINFTIKISPDT